MEKEPRTIKADTSRVLMSEQLRGNLQDDDGALAEHVESASNQFVIVVVDRTVAGQSRPFTGILQTVLFHEKPELEIKVELSEALNVAATTDQVFRGFELHHGQDVTKYDGPFTAPAIRIQEIDAPAQVCVLAFQLERMKV